MQKLRISSTLNLHQYPKINIEEYLKSGVEFLAKSGFDAADFPLFALNYHDENWMSYIENTAEHANKIGIKFELCHLPFTTIICTQPEKIPIFNENMRKAIDAAAYLGVDYAVLHPNTITQPADDFDKNVQYDSVMAHLEPYAEQAAKRGVNLVIENMRVEHKHYPTHRYCQEPEELCEIADALGFGVCWDFGHGNTCGFKQSEALAYIGSRLKVLHVNDNKSIDDDHIPPFLGKIDWKDVAKGLSDIGFKGLFNYELSCDKNPLSVNDSFAKYIINIAHEIMSY